jgi:hypothetical protein
MASVGQSRPAIPPECYHASPPSERGSSRPGLRSPPMRDLGHRLGRNVAARLVLRAPANSARHAHSKLRRGTSPRHLIPDRVDNPFAKINRYRFGHASRPSFCRQNILKQKSTDLGASSDSIGLKSDSTPAVHGEIARNVPLAIGFKRDHSEGAAIVELAAKPIVVETVVADQCADFDTVEQVFDADAVVTLARQEN